MVTPSLATPPHSGEGKDEAASSMGSYYPGVPRFWLRVMMNNREVWTGDLLVIQKITTTSFAVLTLDLIVVR